MEGIKIRIAIAAALKNVWDIKEILSEFIEIHWLVETCSAWALRATCSLVNSELGAWYWESEEDHTRFISSSMGFSMIAALSICRCSLFRKCLNVHNNSFVRSAYRLGYLSEGFLSIAEMTMMFAFMNLRISLRRLCNLARHSQSSSHPCDCSRTSSCPSEGLNA